MNSKNNYFNTEKAVFKSQHLLKWEFKLFFLCLQHAVMALSSSVTVKSIARENFEQML